MNDAQLKKKKKEFETIKPLLKYLNINIAFNPNQDNPDFKFEYKGKIVGLELVTCCPSSKYDSNRKSIAAINQEKRHEAIVRYQKILQERNENLIVEVDFNHNAFWHAEPISKFVDHVIKEIEDLRTNNKEKFLSFNKISAENIDSLQYVESIKLVPLDFGEPIVLNKSGQVMQQINQEDFDHCAKKKYQKLFKYKSQEKNSDIDEYWLAVAEHIKEPYEFWDVPYDTSANTGYKRIFLIGYEGVREIYNVITT